MADDMKPYTRDELNEITETRVASGHLTRGDARRLLATARAGLADSERLDWLATQTGECVLLETVNGVWLGRDNPPPACVMVEINDKHYGVDLRAAIDAAKGSDTPFKQRPQEET